MNELPEESPARRGRGGFSGRRCALGSVAVGLALSSLLFFILRAGTSSPVGHASSVTQVVALDPQKASSVVRSYCALMYAVYSDGVVLAKDLKAAVDRFLGDPTAENLESCKAAWRKAHPFYLQSEVGRFYEGPIDLVESFINAWPVDESNIDYVTGKPDAGMVNDSRNFPSLDPEVLRSANERNGETNITTGWHAIEFLLWGQDLVLGPGGGSRSHLDYVIGGGTAANEARRRRYLAITVDMLVADLESVAQTWAPGQPYNYPTFLMGLAPRAALSKIMSGVATLAFGEVRGERLVVPFTTKDREDEHSCFSDTTHLDHRNDMIGIRNVWEGRYRSGSGAHDYSGPGLRDLAAAADPRIAAKVEASLEACIEALSDPRLDPFECAIRGEDGSPGREAVQRAINRLNEFTRPFLFLAARLNVRINSSLRK
jgi:putative iron-regulated protein